MVRKWLWRARDKNNLWSRLLEAKYGKGEEWLKKKIVIHDQFGGRI